MRAAPAAYVRYTHGFFRKWLPVYDLFAWCIAPIYRVAARELHGGPSRRTLIDLCTGTGEMALRCARAGWTVTAVDITAEMLDKARRKAGDLPIKLAVADARHLPYATAAFDAGVLSLALHDMPRKVRVQVLREATRVARERLLVLDYDFPPRMLLRRTWIRLIDLFESAYFRAFVEDGGLEPLLVEAGLGNLPRRRRGQPLFAVHVIELGRADENAEPE
jgi:ubiquinone/menaquinone biosynthesis C-methylase UbiE